MERLQAIHGVPYGDADLDEFERKLFCPSTPIHEISVICRTLKRIPTARAYGLLVRLQASRRGYRVKGLENAVFECQLAYLEPMNGSEEKEFLTLKLIQELQDEVIYSVFVPEENECFVRRYEIEQDAVRALVLRGQLSHSLLMEFDDYLRQLECGVRFRYCAEDKGKIINQLRSTVQTPRYVDLEPGVMRAIHWDIMAFEDDEPQMVF